MTRSIFLLITMMIAGSAARAQQPSSLPDFRYVCVETIDYSGVKDIFQVSLYTRKWMVQNGYEVISDNRHYWPAQAKQDSCSVITVKLHTHDRFKGKYRTSLFVVDCKADTVFSSEGKSIGPTDAEGFQNATLPALKDLKKELIQKEALVQQNQKGKR